MNINIGDKVYIRCISQPPMDITTIVAKKEKEPFYKKGETLYRDVICCDIDENGKTERVRFKENEHMKNLYGDCLEGYNGKAYLLFATEKERATGLAREKAASKIRAFIGGGKCLIRKDENSPGKRKIFAPADYSLEDMEKIVKILGISALPEYLTDDY